MITICALIFIAIILIMIGGKAMFYGIMLLALIVFSVIFGILNACGVIPIVDTSDVQYAVVMKRTKVMRDTVRPSGFSIGSKGSFRSYYRFGHEYSHTEVKFEVHYNDGSVRHITANVGSNAYQKLIACPSSPPKPKEKPARIQSRPTVAAKQTPPPSKAPELSQAAPAVQESGDKAKPQQEARYVEVPFEVLPNEYGLKVSYPSCQMVKRSSGEYRIYIRFGITYDASVKGVRNRCVKCATVDSAGRMTAVRKEWKVLDLSGGKLVEMIFADNADQEPAKIVVGLDRHN